MIFKKTVSRGLHYPTVDFKLIWGRFNHAKDMKDDFKVFFDVWKAYVDVCFAYVELAPTEPVSAVRRVIFIWFEVLIL